MMRIGDRSFELVRGVSQFRVSIGGRKKKENEQAWMLDAHYVPSAEDYGREDGQPEYFRLTIHPFQFTVSDWRELSQLSEVHQEEHGKDPWLFHTDIENLVAKGRTSDEHLYMVAPGEFKCRHAGGYFFTCEFDGVFKDDEGEKEFTLLDQIPFGQVMLHPAINVKDPVAAGRVIAAREIKLTEFDQTRVTPPHWRREKYPEEPNAPLDSYHYVTLRTPWRQAR
jgi:hypothetical protein